MNSLAVPLYPITQLKVDYIIFLWWTKYKSVRVYQTEQHSKDFFFTLINSVVFIYNTLSDRHSHKSAIQGTGNEFSLKALMSNLKATVVRKNSPRGKKEETLK